MGKKRQRLPDDHEALRRDAEKAARSDRRYPIRSDSNYGFHAGHVPKKRQALIALDVSLNLLVAFFDAKGNFLQVERRNLSPSLNDRDFQKYLKKEFGFKPGLIRVKAFLIKPELLAVHAFPSHFQEFLDNPRDGFDAADRDRYPQSIRTWIANKEFVLDWGNDYWLDDNGEVTSS